MIYEVQDGMDGATTYFATSRVAYDEARRLIFGPADMKDGLVQVVRPMHGPAFICDEEARVRDEKPPINYLGSAAYGFEIDHLDPVLGVVIFLLSQDACEGWTWENEESG